MIYFIGQIFYALFASIGVVVSAYALYDFFMDWYEGSDLPDFRDYSDVDYFG